MNNSEERWGSYQKQKQHCDFLLWWIAQTFKVHWQQHIHTLVPGESGVRWGQGMDRQPCELAGPALPQWADVYSLSRRTELEVKSVIIISQINVF